MRSKKKLGYIIISVGLVFVLSALLLTGYNIYDQYRAGSESLTILEQLNIDSDNTKPSYDNNSPSSSSQANEGSSEGVANSSQDGETIVNGINSSNNFATIGSSSGSQNRQSRQTSETYIPDYVLDPSMDMPVQTVGSIDCVGVLYIPSLGIELPIINELDYEYLRIAPCRYSGSAYTDDFVIAAHNYSTHFGQIHNLSIGHRIVFTDLSGNEFQYKVCDIQELEETAVEEMTTGDWDLTLFTCTLSGMARVTVRCEKI